MSDLLEEALKIRYVKLHFTLCFPEDSVLPVSKTSALRGGIGEMMLRSCCIRDRNCETCDFEDECIVQRTMYSKFRNKPDFVQGLESVGYVIECENYQEFFQAGETLKFNLILFGRTIVYFSQYLQAISLLGQNGIGRNGTKFYISAITNTRGESLLNNGNIYMANYKVETIKDYVEYREQQLSAIPRQLIFCTPVTIKYQGAFIQCFDMEAIVKSVQRRVYILDCFEDIPAEDFYSYPFPVPNILHQEVKPISTRRFSNRKESAMYLKGIKGRIEICPLSEACSGEEEFRDLQQLLLAGELLHIGKNTSFGFGRYRLSE